MNQELRIMNNGKLKSIIHNSEFLIRIQRQLLTFNFKLLTPNGFTLIELLIVIAILGIIAAGIVTALNVTGTIGKANLTKAKTFAASIENDLSINQVGKWSFEETASPSKDTSGHGNNGTWSVGVTWQNAATCGLFGGCMEFDGSNDHVELGGFDDKMPTSEITITAWVKPSVGTGNHDLFSFDPINVEVGGQLGRVTVHFPWSNEIHWQFGTPAQGVNTTVDPSWIGTWNHFVFVASSSKNVRKIYRNGVVIVSGPGSNSFMPSTDSYNWRIGGRASNPFMGLIDEVAIYKEALISYQIQKLYAQGVIRRALAYK